ncbi:MAG TPA: hypothetical protein VEX68_13715 [Bryobacteraceae bacterium]|nr:hypothetical protein [Bryobacteraceae bacterium]
MKRTLPLLLIALPLIGQEPNLNLRKYVPQLVDGAGWQTTVTLINGQDGAAAGILRFFDSAGMPLAMQVRTGASVQNVQSIGLVARGKGIAVVETTGESLELKQGYATFTYEDTPGPGRSVLVNFRQRVPARPDYEAAAPAIPGLNARYGMSFDNTSGFSTAIALVNTDSIVGDYLIAFYDEAGSRIGTSVIGLNSLQHAAVSLPTRFPETAGRRGFFEVSRIPPSAGAAARLFNAAVIALRFNPTGPFSIVPAMDLP